MTDKDQRAQVIQADREAARHILANQNVAFSGAEILRGAADSTPLVQVLMRHRLTHVAALERENARLAVLAANGGPVLNRLTAEEQDALVDFIKSQRPEAFT